VSAHDFLTISQAAECLHDGEIIAYPTEAVYGLGCDPRNEGAVRRLLAMKSRPAEAGLILIADTFGRFVPFTQAVSAEQMERAMSVWPGPVTWLFPRGKDVPDWLAGAHDTVAIRLTAHPVCRALCAEFKGAIVSSSANPRAAQPAMNAGQVEDYFGPELCGIVAGETGGGEKPSEIRDLVSGRVLREG
jgi:L-threonylcarbamoyladenylate synthase